MSFISDIAELNWTDWLRSLLGAGISAAGGAIVTTLMANPIATMLGAPQFSPRQLLTLIGLNAGIAALAAMGGILQKSPLPDRRAIAIALLPGVHTAEDVAAVSKATAPGVVPTAAAAAAILSEAAQPPTKGVDS